MRIGETIKNFAKEAIEDELKKELGENVRENSPSDSTDERNNKERMALNPELIPAGLEKALSLFLQKDEPVLSCKLYDDPNEPSVSMARVVTSGNVYNFRLESVRYERWELYERRTAEQEKERIAFENFAKERFFKTAEKISNMIQSLPPEKQGRFIAQSSYLQMLKNLGWNSSKWAESILVEYEENKREEIAKSGKCYDNPLVKALDYLEFNMSEMDQFYAEEVHYPGFNRHEDDRIEEEESNDEDTRSKETRIFNGKNQLVYEHVGTSQSYGGDEDDPYESSYSIDVKEFGYAYGEDGKIVEVRCVKEDYWEGYDYNPREEKTNSKSKVSYENGKISSIHIDSKRFLSDSHGGPFFKKYDPHNVGSSYWNFFKSKQTESSEDILISYDDNGSIVKIERKGIEKTSYFDGDVEKEIREVLFEKGRGADLSEEEASKMVQDIAMLRYEFSKHEEDYLAEDEHERPDFKYETPESKEDLRLEEKSWDSNDGNYSDSGVTRKYRNDSKKVVRFEANRSSSIRNESSGGDDTTIELSYGQDGQTEGILYDRRSSGDNDDAVYSKSSKGKADFVYALGKLEKVTVTENCHEYHELAEDERLRNEGADYQREVEYSVNYDADGGVESVVVLTSETLNNTKTKKELFARGDELYEGMGSKEIILQDLFPADHSYLV